MKLNNVLKRVAVFTITLCLSITTIGIIPTFAADTTQYGLYELKVNKVNITENNTGLSDSEKEKLSAILKNAIAAITVHNQREQGIVCTIRTNEFTFEGKEMFLSEIGAEIRGDDNKTTTVIAHITNDKNGRPFAFTYSYSPNDEVLYYSVSIRAKDGSFEKVVNITFDTEVVSFTSDEYSLIYDSGEGYGTMQPITVTNGQNYVFPQCTFEKPDKKTFDHWKMSGVDGIFQPDGDVKIASNCAQEGKITVTAYWKEAPEATVKKDATAKALRYNGKAQDLVTKGVAINGKIQYVLGLDNQTAPKTGWNDSVPQKTKVGTYYVWYRATGDATHSNSEAKCCTAVIKDAPIMKGNTLSIKGKTIKVKYKKLKKKSQKIKAKKYIKFKNKGQGKLKYKLAKVKKSKFKKYFKINKKTGKLTIKKKLKKGKYKLTVKVMALGDANHKASNWKSVTIKVRVK